MDQDLKKQIASVNESVRSQQGSTDNNLADLTTISSKNLGGQTIDIPTEPPSTAIKGELASFESQADSFTQNLEKQAKDSQQQEEVSFNELLQQATASPTQGQIESRTFSQRGGVDDINKELVGINNQIRAEQQALRRKVEYLQTGSGLTKGQVDQEVSEMERVSLRKQADLAVIQQSVQGRYDSAKTIADRAIQAEVDFEKKKLDLAQIAYDRNKSLFDKTEQRLFETQQADRNRKLEQQEKNMQEISDLSIQALQDGAPSSLVASMRSAKTVEEAIKIGGRFVGALDREAKLASIAASGASAEASRLSARKALIDLAKEGDRSAIAKLGYDPSVKPEDILVKEKVSTKAQEDVTRLEGLLKNTAGLKTSSGIIKNPLLSIFSPAGGILRVPSDISSKQKFVNDVDYIAKNITFDRIKELSDQGVKLTPLSNSDMQAIAQSSSELVTAIRREDNEPTGKITGIDLPEEEVTRIISDMLVRAKRVQNELNIKDAFNMEELGELSNI